MLLSAVEHRPLWIEAKQNTSTIFDMVAGNRQMLADDMHITADTFKRMRLEISCRAGGVSNAINDSNCATDCIGTGYVEHRPVFKGDVVTRYYPVPHCRDQLKHQCSRGPQPHFRLSNRYLRRRALSQGARRCPDGHRETRTPACPTHSSSRKSQTHPSGRKHYRPTAHLRHKGAPWRRKRQHCGILKQTAIAR